MQTASVATVRRDWRERIPIDMVASLFWFTFTRHRTIDSAALTKAVRQTIAKVKSKHAERERHKLRRISDGMCRSVLVRFCGGALSSHNNATSSNAIVMLSIGDAHRTEQSCCALGSDLAVNQMAKSRAPDLALSRHLPIGRDHLITLRCSAPLHIALLTAQPVLAALSAACCAALQCAVCLVRRHFLKPTQNRVPVPEEARQRTTSGIPP